MTTVVGQKSSSKVVQSATSLAPSAAEFVPRTLAQSNSNEFIPSGISSMNGLNSAAASWVPQSISISQGQQGNEVENSENNDATDTKEEDVMVEVNWNGSMFFVPSSMAYAYTSQGSEPEGGHRYQRETADNDVGLDWSFGASTLPAPPVRTLQTIGIPDPIRQHFQSLDIDSSRQLPPDDERYNEVPSRYHSIFLLDNNSAHRGAGGSFGYPSSLYKVTDRSDSQLYALRRFDNIRNSQATVIKNALTRWLEIRHPAIVSLYGISQERGGALFFSHAYHPTAVTLKQRFIDNSNGSPPSEAMLWRILNQLVAGLRLIHNRGLAVRHISPIHILMTSGTLARINSVGVTDVLEFESRKSIAELQTDDIIKLGYVILSLGSSAMVTAKSAEVATNQLHQHYSLELFRVVSTMISGKISISQLGKIMIEKIQDEYDSNLAAADALHSHLRGEYENGRMLRLLLKLGFVNERPEYSRAPEWSETGDRYVLKLFRDYVFHQTMEDGAPILDAGHVMSCLNKLDCGESQKILLCSRDGKDFLVVTFADIRRCLEDTFGELNHLSDNALARLQSQSHANMDSMDASTTINSYPSYSSAAGASSMSASRQPTIKSFNPSNMNNAMNNANVGSGLSAAAPVFVLPSFSPEFVGGGDKSGLLTRNAAAVSGSSSGQSVFYPQPPPPGPGFGGKPNYNPNTQISGSRTPQPTTNTFQHQQQYPTIRHSASAGSALSQQGSAGYASEISPQGNYSQQTAFGSGARNSPIYSDHGQSTVNSIPMYSSSASPLQSSLPGLSANRIAYNPLNRPLTSSIPPSSSQMDYSRQGLPHQSLTHNVSPIYPGQLSQQQQQQQQQAMYNQQNRFGNAYFDGR